MSDCNCKHGAGGGTGVLCVECDIPQLARNNYFTGKLLVERDFTDEQRYLLGKLRRHNQRLHGWGIVCGLKVKQHPIPGCQDRFVVIEPGTAIDCCGREILVTREEYFDFEAQFLAKWQQQNGPNSQPDPKATHKIQICISYRECGTEDIPALFDDCSCDATSCQPNRILDSYGFDVLIDQKSSAADAAGAQLEPSQPLHFANAIAVAESDESKLLYILTSSTSGGTNTARLYQLDANGDVLASAVFSSSAGLDVQVSPHGDFVYVAVQPDGGTSPEITVFASSDLSTVVSQFTVGAASDTTLRMGVVPAPDGRILVIGKTVGVFAVSGMNVPAPAPPPLVTPVAGIGSPVALAISPGGQYAYVTAGGADIEWITLSSLTFSATPIALPAGSAISSISVSETTKGDTLAALDTSAAPALYFVSIPAAGPASATVIPQNVTGFTHPPMQVVMSVGGQWAYVLEEDTATKAGYVQPVNEYDVETNQPGSPLGAAVPIGMSPISMEISESGAHLYVPFTGDPNVDNGGVAVFDVTATSCCGLIQQTIDGCPDCPDGNCMVLATINRYQYGQAVVDANIDNLTDRHFLVSTDILTQVVQCLCEQGGGSGGTGPQGPPGAPGAPGGQGIQGIQGIQGLPGTPGTVVQNTYVKIAQISWPHNGNLKAVTLREEKFGLLVAFNDNVQSADLTPDSVAVLLPTHGTLQTTWNEADIKVIPGNFAAVGVVTSPFSPVAPFNGFEIQLPEIILKFVGMKIRVVVRGDFIRDTTPNQFAIDADHLPPWVPASMTGDGIEGGTFESWFTLVAQ